MHLVMIGGSDAGISAALRAGELDTAVEVTVVAADAYPNFSICGIPYYVSGEVTHWRNLAHRTSADLEATGMRLRLDTTVRPIDVRPQAHCHDRRRHRRCGLLRQAHHRNRRGPVRPPIIGLTGPDALGAVDGVHLLHSLGDTFALMRTLEDTGPATAVIVGAGYIGLEMADALATRGLSVIQMEQLPEVLPTVDPGLGTLVRDQLAGHGAEVLTGTTVRQIRRSPGSQPGRLVVEATDADGQVLTRRADVVLVVVGVRPDTGIAVSAGAALGVKARSPWIGACTRPCLASSPPGTASPPITGSSATPTCPWAPGASAPRSSRSSTTPPNRTARPRSHSGGLDPVTIEAAADDHKAYSHRITMRVTGDQATGRLLGMQMFGHRHAEIAKRIDIAATAIYHGMTVDAVSDLDLSYTPPLGSPWDAVQIGAQACVRQVS